MTALLPVGGDLEVLSYGSALLLFLLNLPGVMVLQLIYRSSVSPTLLEKILLVAGMVAITSSLLFMALWCFGKIRDQR